MWASVPRVALGEGCSVEIGVNVWRRAQWPTIPPSDLVDKPAAIPWWTVLPLRGTTYNGTANSPKT